MKHLLTRELALVDDVNAKTKAVEAKAKSIPGQKVCHDFSQVLVHSNAEF